MTEVDLDHLTPLGRLEGDELQLLSFELARGERRIQLLGMQHIAIASFYTDRLRQIETRPKSVVLCEEMHSADRKTEMSQEIQEIIELFEARTRRILELFPEKLVDQKTHFKLDPQRSRNADFTLKEFFDDPLTLQLLTQSANMMREEHVTSSSDKLCHGYWQQTLESLTTNPQQDFLTMMRTFQTERMFRISERNNRVVELVEQLSNEGKDSCIPWGALHLPGINKALQAQAWHYVPGSKSYTTFMNRGILHA